MRRTKPRVIMSGAVRGTPLQGQLDDEEEDDTAMYARVTEIKFPPSLDKEVVGAAKGLVTVLNDRQGYRGLDVLTDAVAGEGLIVSFWDTADDAEASENDPSYIAQISRMSSFLTEKLVPRGYLASVRN